MPPSPGITYSQIWFSARSQFDALCAAAASPAPATPTFMCCELICMRLEYAIRRRHSFLETCTGQVGVINTSLFGFGIVANRRHGTSSQPRNANYPPPRALRDAKHSCGFWWARSRVSYFLALGRSAVSTEVAEARSKTPATRTTLISNMYFCEYSYLRYEYAHIFHDFVIRRKNLCLPPHCQIFVQLWNIKKLLFF
jgi:hypothetical protein